MSTDQYDRHEASYVLASVALHQERVRQQALREQCRGKTQGKSVRQPIGALDRETRRKP